jgi:hypothetical protein
VWLYISVIPAVKRLRLRLRLKDVKFKDNLGYIVLNKSLIK